MASRPLQQIASTMHRPLHNLRIALGSAANRVLRQAGPKCTSRPAKPALQLPVSIVGILQDRSKLRHLEDSEVPDIVSSNPLWRSLCLLDKEVYELSRRDSLAALLVVLPDTAVQLVVKGWPAHRASGASAQIAAELDAAKCFAWHPNMATPVAAAFDEAGNFCSVSAYAGCSLQSIITHPDWFMTVSAQDRLEFVRLMILQMMTVFDIMQTTGVGHFYRDVKPDNIVVHPTTGLTSVIDYGLKVWSNMKNYHPGDTLGYWTPEIINPGSFGWFPTYFTREKTIEATNNTTDVFLASYVALQAAVGLDGLPWFLRAQDHDTDTASGLLELMIAHAMAAADDYAQLIDRVACPLARDYFEKTMRVNPAQRLTPVQALQHPWLLGCTAAVQKTASAALPAHQQVNKQLLDLFSGVPGVLLPQQQEQAEPSAFGSARSASSIDAQCCTTANSCLEHTASFPQTSRCCSSSDDAAADQHPAAAAAAAAPLQRKPSLLQRGKKLLSRISQSSSKKFLLTQDSLAERTDSNRVTSKAVGGATAAPVVIAVQAWLDDNSHTASVPGLCGLSWFG